MDTLTEDLTEKFYECGTDHVKHWLISNLDQAGHTSEQINQLSINQLKDLFINTSLRMIKITAFRVNR